VKAAHLARRFFGSLRRTPPSDDDARWAREWLTPGEQALWESMSDTDRRHSVEVTRRFAAGRPAASREEMAGALLHDVGKVQSGLGTFGRVLATVAGPRTRRFRQYREHEDIGANMAAQAHSSPATVELIRGRGPAAADLRAADDSI
jgi:hypothetical protein